MYSSSSSLSSDGAGAAARLPMPGFGQPPMAEAIKAMAIGSVSASSSSLTTGAAAGAARTIAANHAANSSAEMRSVSRFDATSSNTGSAVVAASASAPVPSSSSSSSSLSSSFSSSTTAARLAAARALSSEPTSDDSNAQTGSGAAPTTGARTSAGPAVAHPASTMGAASSMHSTAGLKARPLSKSDPKAAYRQRIARALSAQPNFSDICRNSSSSDITAPLQTPLEVEDVARESSSSRSVAAVAASGAAAKDTIGEGKERAAADDGGDRPGDAIMGDWLDSEAISSANSAAGSVNNSTLTSRGRPSSFNSSSSAGAESATHKASADAAATSNAAAASAAHLAEWAEARRLKREGIDVNAAPPLERKKKVKYWSFCDCLSSPSALLCCRLIFHLWIYFVSVIIHLLLRKIFELCRFYFILYEFTARGSGKLPASAFGQAAGRHQAQEQRGGQQTEGKLAQRPAVSALLSF